jgi:hypothetical protein
MSKVIYERKITCKNGKEKRNCNNCIFAYGYDDCHIADMLRPEGKEWDGTEIKITIHDKAVKG